jgi:hypothetical protein
MNYEHLQGILKAMPGTCLTDSADLMIGRVDGSSGEYSESAVSDVRIAFDYNSTETTPKARLIFIEE